MWRRQEITKSLFGENYEDIAVINFDLAEATCEIGVSFKKQNMILVQI